MKIIFFALTVLISGPTFAAPKYLCGTNAIDNAFTATFEPNNYALSYDLTLNFLKKFAVGSKSFPKGAVLKSEGGYKNSNDGTVFSFDAYDYFTYGESESTPMTFSSLPGEPHFKGKIRLFEVGPDEEARGQLKFELKFECEIDREESNL
jgi:hypothetical protein